MIETIRRKIDEYVVKYCKMPNVILMGIAESIQFELENNVYENYKQKINEIFGIEVVEVEMKSYLKVGYVE